MMFGKLKKRLRFEYGKTPNAMYFDGDMNWINAHYEFRKGQGLDEFLVDDITWHDLSMDDLFKQINTRLTTSGEQYLYYLLRSPTLKEDEYDRRYELIEFVETNPDLRLKLQVAFAKLGRRRGVQLHQLFTTADSRYEKIFLYAFLALALVGTFVGGTLLGNPFLALMFISLLIFNSLYHHFTFKKIEHQLQTVSYIMAMVGTAKKVKKLDISELSAHLEGFYKSVERLKHIQKTAFTIQDNKGAKDEISLVLTFMLNNFFLLDLFAFELVRNKLGKYHQDIFNIHETIGALDASISIASYRQSLGEYTVPTIDFSDNAEISLQLTDVVHPLVKNPIVNSLDTDTPILLTGSNASGKSTFLRSVTLNMIMAQSICTVVARSYEAPAFYIYSSMAIADNLLAGDSYFIAEIKSMKRIVDAINTKHPVFCVIDEILRGTNTVERISASSELLKLMAKKGALCLSATHDIELCELLKGDYEMFHFTEQITATGDVVFDYQLRKGRAMTRNAIKLLDTLGFDDDLVKSANERAILYEQNGKW